jgi:transposase-like protein
MARRPDATKQDRWRELIHRWQCSQTTVREFCQRHRVSEASFFSWRRVLRERGLMDDALAQARTPAC